MTFTIGRASFECGPYGISHDGDRLSFGVNIDGATTTDPVVAKVIRQQMLGLVNNRDEPVVPVTWDGDSDFDGFYRPVAVKVDPFDTYLDAGLMVCTVDLERVGGGYAFPSLELFTGAITRTNSHALTGDALTAVVPDVSNAIRDSSAWLNNTATRACADSAAGVSEVRIFSAEPTLTPFVYSYWLQPSLHYFGACRVEVLVGGSWYELSGRQNWYQQGAWRISNGVVRLTSGEPGTIEVFNGTAWESANIRHVDAAVGALGAHIGLSYASGQSPLLIIRNSPERVTVRCAAGTYAVDYSIQRGAMHVEFSSPIKIGIGYATTTACTAVTGGIRTTSNDASGNRLVFAIAQTNTVDTTNGRVYQSLGGSNLTTGMIGVALDGSGATSFNTESALVNQFIGVAPVTQRVVSR